VYPALHKFDISILSLSVFW